MAYNPFNIFRRNQKAIFAVITVFIMFTFVLSSGLGGGADFFDWFPQWLGGKTQKGDLLCTIDGKKVRDGDVAKLRRQRLIANRYMSLAADMTMQSLVQYYNTQVTAEGNKRIEALFRNPTGGDVTAGLRAIANDSKAPEGDRNAARAVLARDAIAQARMGNDPLAQLDPNQYFATAPNRTTRDVVNFMLWEKKADQLGIRLTDDDVNALIQKEFFNQFKADADVRRILAEQMSDFKAISPAALLKLIGAEFRVRMAQTALLGVGGGRPDHTLTAPPTALTPYEQYKFYEEQTSGTVYKLLPVPAAAFLPGVTDTPPDSELNKLYQKYRDDQPNPARETPGFKDPRMVKVAFLDASGEEKYYQDAAKEVVAKAEARAVLGSLLTVPVPGAGPAWAAGAVAPLAVKVKYGTVGPNDPLVDLALAGVYQGGAFKEHQQQLRSNFGVTPFDTLKVRAHSAGSTVLALAQAANGIGGYVAAAALAERAPAAADVRARVAIGPIRLTAADNPGVAALAGPAIAQVRYDQARQRVQFGFQSLVPLGLPALFQADPMGTRILSTLGAEAWASDKAPQPLPLAAVRPELLKKVTDEVAKVVRNKDLETFKKDVTKLATEPGKSREDREKAAREAIAKFAAGRGLKVHESAGLVSELTIEDDPGLAPLRALRDTPLHGNLPAPFGGQFFREQPNPRTGHSEPTRDNFKPEFYPNAPSPTATGKVYLAWRTQDQPPRNVTFAEAKPRVLEAWRRTEARKRAKDRADAIQKTLADKHPTHESEVMQLLFQARNELAEDPKLVGIDWKVRERIRLFPEDSRAKQGGGAADAFPDPLLNVAPKPILQFGQQTVLGNFRLFPTVDLKYPTPEMEKALVENRTKPVGTSLVLADAPKDTYYVAVVLHREVRKPEDFKEKAFAPRMATQGGVGQQLRAAEQAEAYKVARDSVLALLKKEFNYAETEEQAKKLDQADRSEASGE